MVHRLQCETVNCVSYHSHQPGLRLPSGNNQSFNIVTHLKFCLKSWQTLGIRKAICLNNLEVACRQTGSKWSKMIFICQNAGASLLHTLCPGCQIAGECGGCHIDIIHNGQMVAGSRTAEQRLCAVCALLLIFPPANIDIQTQQGGSGGSVFGAMINQIINS